MKKNVILIFFSTFFIHFSFGQNTPLIINTSGEDFFVDYEVQSGDNFYSVGRMFNVAPQYLASFNKLQLTNGLKKNEKLRVPLTNLNFTKKLFKSSSEALVPVYHVIEPSETLFRLGNKFGESVPLSEIRSWNEMTDDNVKLGHPYIIGFLKVDKKDSPLASRDFKIGSIASNAPVNSAPQKSNTEKPAPVSPVTSSTVNSSKSDKEGFFKSEFEEEKNSGNQSSIVGKAATFKSTSGWQDGKYYCFSDNINQGSIVKISQKDGNKFIYAKVLDGIPDIRQNNGLVLVLSNSAADALGIADTHFEANIQYFK